MTSPPPESSLEVFLQGFGVSPGVRFAPAYVYRRAELSVPDYAIVASEVEWERQRFHHALSETRSQVKALQHQMLHTGQSGLFDAHLMILADEAMISTIDQEIAARLRNVEVLAVRYFETIAVTLDEQEDAYLCERAHDIRDIARRLLSNLAGQTDGAGPVFRQDCILVAEDLSPSEMAILSDSHIKAIVLQEGSSTSHTAILARARELPTIMGLPDLMNRVQGGDPLLVDGVQGRLYIAPSPERSREVLHLDAQRLAILSRFAQVKEEPRTRDGALITVSANIELPEELGSVVEHGAHGVGLFRTEFLFLGRRAEPSENEQTRIYKKVAEAVNGAPVILRTLDLGGDKLGWEQKQLMEVNPFLGCRAIRYCLERPALFRTQLRAVLRASVHTNIRLMYPMVSVLREVQDANALLASAQEELRNEGIPFNENLQVGVMIEVPSAALAADLIAPHVKFFSLGTNDLVQYTMAADRGNRSLARLYRASHPAILRLIHATVQAGKACGIWTGVCGEMAGDPLYIPLLIGLGVEELSVSPPFAPAVKALIRQLDGPMTKALAEKARACQTADEVDEACRNLVQEVLPEILELR